MSQKRKIIQCERNTKEKKSIVSDKLLKRQIQIELEVTKDLIGTKT